MIARKNLFLISSLMAVIALAGCGTTSHPTAQAAMGTTSGSDAMERLLDQPGLVELETIISADWSVALAGLLNLNSEAAKKAGMKDREEPIHVYAHVLKHPKYGNFLVDTGVSQKLLNEPDTVGMSWLMRKGMRIEKMKVQKSTAEILRDIHGPLSGVFFTHLHIDHISGMPDIANDVPLYIGRTEATEKYLINLVSHGSTDALLNGKARLLEWDFKEDPQHRLVGVIDIFGDGSVFAISVPGHTSGSTAYLIRTPKGPVLLTGDVSHTRWGWDNGVEPGDYTRDNDRNLKSLMSLKELANRHPALDVRLGHQQ